MCISENNYARALRVLNESIELDNNYADLVRTYRIQRLDIYLLP